MKNNEYCIIQRTIFRSIEAYFPENCAIFRKNFSSESTCPCTYNVIFKKIDRYVLSRLDEDVQCDMRSPSESYVSHVTHVMI